MTFILTLVGIVAFIVSLFTANLKTAWKRLVMFVITGIVLDVLIGFVLGTIMFLAMN